MGKDLSEIMIAMSDAFGIHITLMDANFVNIYEDNRRSCTLCSLVKRTASGVKDCYEDDGVAYAKCKQTKDAVFFRCHAGILTPLIPVNLDGVIVGYISMDFDGVCLSEAEKSDRINLFSKRYGISVEELALEYGRQQTIDEGHARNVAKIVELAVRCMWLERIVSPVTDHKLSFDIYVARHMTDDLSVRAICAGIGISKKLLYSVVYENYGIGVAEYVRKIRLEEARKLLSATGRPIKIIAADVGINDYNLFSKLFKKYYGESPRDYRKSFHGGGKNG